MISLSLAQKLKQAGLIWRAGNNDFFAIPDRGMDDRIFVISDLMSNLDIFRGWPVVTFHGSAEWALDYILTAELVWLPTEEQLRNSLIDKLGIYSQQSIILSFNNEHYSCSIIMDGQIQEFISLSGSDAYALALLYLLEQQDSETNN